MSADPALTEYLPVAPTSDEAREHNQNLPGMGGVFTPVNLQIYHYGANNPLKYVDPAGTDIMHVGLLGIGLKVGVGGNVQVGLAWDDNGMVTGYATVGVGIGVEGSVDTPFSPSFSISKGKNISDLSSALGGLYRYDTGTTSTIGMILGGVIYDQDTNELIGGSILSAGGGISEELTLYFDSQAVIDYVKEAPAEVRDAFIEALELVSDNFDVQLIIDSIIME